MTDRDSEILLAVTEAEIERRKCASAQTLLLFAATVGLNEMVFVDDNLLEELGKTGLALVTTRACDDDGMVFWLEQVKEISK